MNDKVMLMNSILNQYSIDAVCVGYECVDNYYYYDLVLQNKTKIKDVSKFLDEISLILKSASRPSINIKYDLGVVRLQFAKINDSPLKLFDYFTNTKVPEGELICLLGKSAEGKPVWMDLCKNPHMLVAGTTGSGKSTLLHNIIGNLLNYNSAKLFLVDTKNIEFNEYQLKNISDVNVSYTYYEALFILDLLLDTMENRFSNLRDNKSLYFPPIVLIIDEFADLIMQDKNDEFYEKLCRLAQKSRAAKIHIVLATQRPSVNILNGTIKANFPTRIACRVASGVDSKVILDECGAEDLIGKGDSFLKDSTRSMERFQIAYTDCYEICKYFGTK